MSTADVCSPTSLRATADLILVPAALRSRWCAVLACGSRPHSLQVFINYAKTSQRSPPALDPAEEHFPETESHYSKARSTVLDAA